MIASKPIICYYEGYQSIINEAKCGDFVEFGNTEALRRTLAKYTKLNANEIHEIGKRGKDFLLKNRTFSQLAIDYQSFF